MKSSTLNLWGEDMILLILLFLVGSPSPVYYVEISISGCQVSLYEKRGKELVLLEKFKAATAKKGLDVYPLGRGYITGIEFNPTWGPTGYSRSYFKKEKGIDLPKIVPPGDPLNYMGAFKIHLSHKTRKGDIYRIHGNNDPTKIGQRATGGCIRMDNKEGTRFAKLVSVGTEVNIVP